MANKVIFRLVALLLICCNTAASNDRMSLLRTACSNQATPFVTPASYPGLSMWYDASDTSTITGSPVSQWNDKSGNGNHLIQPTAGQRPTTGTLVNTRNSITFAGNNGASSQWMYVTGVTNSPNTVFVVFKSATASWADWDGWFSWRSVSSDKVSNSGSSGGVHGVNGTGLVYTTGTSLTVRTDGVGGALAASFNDFNTGVGFLTAINANAHLVAYTDDITSTTNNFVVGADSFSAVGARHANGNLCEIIVYNWALGLTEIRFVEAYLIAKWITVQGGGGD